MLCRRACVCVRTCVYAEPCVSRQAELLTGSSVTSTEEAHRAAQELLRRGCRSVIITLGPQGCVVLRAQDSAWKHVPTAPVTAADTTVSAAERVKELRHVSCVRFRLLVQVFPGWGRAGKSHPNGDFAFRKHPRVPIYFIDAQTIGNYSISEARNRKCFAHLDKLRRLTVPSAAYWVSPSLSSLRLLVWVFDYVPNLCFPVEADCFVFFLLFLMCLVNWTALLDYKDSSHSLTVFISSPFPLKIEKICIFVFLNIY